jgi:hypothetical protein
MPFSVRPDDLPKYFNDTDHWRQVYEGLIVPAVEKAGLSCERDDDEVASRLIAENVWRKIEAADVILCDLSTGNPNVLLEFGWALRADKRFVLVKDELTSFTFDLNQFYTYTYSHKLQPVTLRTQIDELATVLAGTMRDENRRYSMASRLERLGGAGGGGTGPFDGGGGREGQSAGSIAPADSDPPACSRQFGSSGVDARRARGRSLARGGTDFLARRGTRPERSMVAEGPVGRPWVAVQDHSP